MTASGDSAAVRPPAGSRSPLWVFGYGSLMWKPGFAYVDAQPARLEGYRRAFCIYSLHYRGSEQRPGLVLGLLRGGTCEGIAFRIADHDAAAVRAYLHARELIYGVYREAFVPALIGAPAPHRADVLTYVAEPAHPSFAGPLSLSQQAGILRGARGVAGCNLAYLAASLEKLRSLGIRQRDLERLSALAGARVYTTGEEACVSNVLAARCRAFRTRPAPRAPLRNDRRHAFAFRRRLQD